MSSGRHTVLLISLMKCILDVSRAAIEERGVVLNSPDPTPTNHAAHALLSASAYSSHGSRTLVDVLFCDDVAL